MWYDPLNCLCDDCGNRLVALKNLTRKQRTDYDFYVWMQSVLKADKNGLSPGGAAAELKCSRAMIDKLVEAGSLERSQYEKDGHFIVLISWRSILKVKQTKKETGQWKPR